MAIIIRKRTVDFTLNHLLKYADKVLQLGAIVNGLVKADGRASNSSIPAEIFWIGYLSMFLLGYDSLNNFWSIPQNVPQIVKLRQNLFGGSDIYLPSRSAAERFLSKTDPLHLLDVLLYWDGRWKETGALAANSIDGLVTAALDGIEHLLSHLKDWPQSLLREHRNGTKDHYFRSVVLMQVGGFFKPILAEEMFTGKVEQAGEILSKGEVERTAAKRLVEKCFSVLASQIDLLVVDALYCNAPFVSLVLGYGVDVIVRLKDERLKITKIAHAWFDAGNGYVGTFETDNDTKVFAYQCPVQMDGVSQPLAVYRFKEMDKKGHLKQVEVLTSLVDPEYAPTILKAIHARWNEENGFQYLKDSKHIDHCFSQEAVHQHILLNCVTYNLEESFIKCCCARDFRDSGLTKKNVREAQFIDAVEHPVNWWKYLGTPIVRKPDPIILPAGSSPSPDPKEVHDPWNPALPIILPDGPFPPAVWVPPSTYTSSPTNEGPAACILHAEPHSVSDPNSVSPAPILQEPDSLPVDTELDSLSADTEPNPSSADTESNSDFSEAVPEQTRQDSEAATPLYSICHSAPRNRRVPILTVIRALQTFRRQDRHSLFVRTLFLTKRVIRPPWVHASAGNTNQFYDTS